MLLDAQGIVKQVAQRALELRRLGVRRLALFGSLARGEARPDSDADFLVELESKSFDRFMDVKFLLEELLGRRVDLVTFDGLKSAIRDEVDVERVDVPGF